MMTEKEMKQVLELSTMETAEGTILGEYNGEVIGESEVETIYTPSRPMSKAYETGYFGSVYKARRKRSKTGGNEQVPQYSSLYPNTNDMREAGSHFYDRILEMLEDEW